MSNLPARAVRTEQNGGGDTEAVTPSTSGTSSATEGNRREEVSEGNTEPTSEPNMRAGRKKTKRRAK